MYSATSAILLAATIYIVRYITQKTIARSKLPLPPGPRRLPIVGNALAIDTVAPWVTYKNWGDTYGSIIYSRLLNQDVIVINSEKVAKDLVESRSSNYSDRPNLVTVELFGWTYNAAFLHYGNEWRMHRRFFHEKMRPDAARTYRPLQVRKIHELLVKIVEKPAEFAHYIQMFNASTVMMLVYGYETERDHDPLVSLADASLSQGLAAVTPETAAILGAWPFLLHIPSWFPGGGFQRRARECREVSTEMVEQSFNYTKKRMESDDYVPCFLSELLDRIENEENYDELVKVVKRVASTSLVGSVETTTTTLLNFILAMILYPDVQDRAQAEIDAVVGSNRLPNFNDRDSLLYVEAVLRESHRWHPVLPLCVPHATVDDDIYEGFFIPKGATIIPNVWAMTRDESKYTNADDFIPERFFTEDAKLNDDTINYAFGFGRRVCPGRHIADASSWAAMVSMLAIFKFSKAKDEQGNDIEFTPQWLPGVVVRPAPFPCDIKLRSPDVGLEHLHELINLCT